MFTMTMKKKLMAFGLLVTGLFTAAMPATAQTLIVDQARIEQEAAAFKDFRLQTQELRTNINQLNNYIKQGGALEQQAYELEKKKAVIGPQKYEEELNKLRQQNAQFQRALQQRQVIFNQLIQEFGAQTERAQSPILREILTERKADLILPKRITLVNGPGLDITTEVIERLDAVLSTVDINVPDLTPEQPAEGAAAQPAKK